MPLLTLTAAVGALWLGAVEAPITSVTVYSDRARVVRTARLNLSGTQRVELPLLPPSVNASSIRVEAQGAEVTGVDIRPVAPESLPPDEARKRLDELERLEDRLAQLSSEREAVSAQLSSLGRVRPLSPEPKPGEPNPPRLDPSGWAAATTFVTDTTARLQARTRELDQQEQSLQRERERLLAETRRSVDLRQRPGLAVAPTLSGSGPTTLTLTYFTSRARWYPSYELRLEPDAQRVNVAFSGRVSQESGEDWQQASLTLSTALPATATALPRLTTWKIGQKDRFIPTPPPLVEPPAPPPPAPTPLPKEPDASLQAREALLTRLGASPSEQGQGSGRAALGAVRAPPPPPPPAPPPPSQRYGSRRERAAPSAPAAEEYLGEMQEMIVVSRDSGPPKPPPTPVGITPPAAWRRPAEDPRSPAALAGGYDLAFTAPHPETVPSQQGERLVPLFTERWPVQVERKLFPALAPEAFLVAELSSPSKQVLPGGQAQLFVGADQAGTAWLDLVSPGEPFTLPLGVDRAVRSVRNVQLSTSEEGLLSKEEVTEYKVTIEVPNPYSFPLAVRVHDQWPLSRHERVQVKLLHTEPQATRDEVKGTLEWRLTVPASGKSTVAFHYTLRQPKGWRLYQRP